MTSPTPQTVPIDGAALLDEVEAFHRRFNIFPTEAAYVTVAPWDLHAHLLDCFDSTPRLAFLPPEPGSGKSRALEIVETLVPRPMVAVNASAPPRSGRRPYRMDGPPSTSTRSTPCSAPRPETAKSCAASSRASPHGRYLEVRGWEARRRDPHPLQP